MWALIMTVYLGSGNTVEQMKWLYDKYITCKDKEMR